MPNAPQGQVIIANGDGTSSFQNAVGIASSLTQASWFIDPANSTGLASNSNSGLTALLPVLSMAEVQRRLGSLNPTLPQQTTFKWLSSGTSTDPYLLVPNCIGTGGVVLAGNPTVTATTTIGTFTPQNRAAGTLNKITASGISTWTPGQFIHDTTAGASFWVVADLGGGVASISNPVASLGGPGPSPVTIANGDTIQFLTLPTVYAPNLLQGSYGSSFLIAQQLAFAVSGSDQSIVGWNCLECSFTGIFLSAGAPSNSSGGGSFANCYLYYFIGRGNVRAGVITSFGQLDNLTLLDGDVVCTTALNVLSSGVISLGAVYMTASPSNVNSTVTFQVQVSPTYGPSGRGAVWGPHTFNVARGAQLIIGSGTTAQVMLGTGGLQLDGSTSNAWAPGSVGNSTSITVSQANVDAYGGLFNPVTGSRISVPSTAPINVLTQATWFIDPANSTGLAADSNSGLTALLPVLTWKGGVIAKYGTNTPTLSQLTTFTWLSSAPSTDPYLLLPNCIGTGGVLLAGTTTVSSTTTIGTFTPQSRAAGTLNKITASGVASWTAGQLLHDTTAGASFWVVADLGGGVASISNPVAILGSAPKTIANGDTLQFITLPTVYAPDLDFTAYASGGLSAQQISFNDLLQKIDGWAITECSFINVSITAPSQIGALSAPSFTNCYFVDFDGCGTFKAGTCNGSAGFNSFTNETDLDGDVVISNSSNLLFTATITLRAVYLGGAFINQAPGVALKTLQSPTYGPSGRGVVWGPHTFNVSNGAQLTINSGTATQIMLGTGGLQLDGSASNGWVAGSVDNSPATPVTVANVDCFGGIFSPVTGSRISVAATAPISVINQATWFIDPTNSTGLASDSNSGIDATHPVLTWNGGVIRKWGTYQPIFTSLVTVTWLSAGTAADSIVRFAATLLGAGGLRLVGTPTASTTGTIGTFTAPNFTTGARGTITASGGAAGFWSTLVGQSVHDTTAGVTFVVEADLGTATAQISTSLAYPIPSGGTPGTYTNPANGDAFTVNANTKIFVNQFEVYNLGTAAGGGVEFRSLELSSELESLYNTQCTFTDCKLSATLIGSRKSFDSSGGPTCQSCFISGNLQGQWNLLAGAATGFPFFNDQSRLDGDVWLKNAVPWQGNLSTPRAYFQTAPSTGFMRPGNSISVLISSYTGVSRLWGVGGLNAARGTTLILASGTAASTLLLTGALQLDGVSTGWVAGSVANSPSIPVSVANVDYYGGVFNPVNGSGIFSTSTTAPINVLTQATWFIDPQNSTGLAADSNSGLTALLPVLTWNTGVLAKYGTNAPSLAQNVTFTFLSSQTVFTDPIIFNPIILNGAQVTIQGTLVSVATVSLTGVVAKNRSTPQLLNANLGASAAAGMFAVNTTHASRAWVWKSLGSNVFAMTQPITAVTPNTFVPGLTGVDTWTNGDSVTLYNPTQIYLVEFNPVFANISGSTFESFPAIYNCVLLTHTSVNPPVILNTMVELLESWSQQSVYFSPSSVASGTPSNANAVCANLAGGFESGKVHNLFSGCVFFAGAVGLPSSFATIRCAGMRADFDCIISGNTNGSSFTIGTLEAGLVYLDTGTTLDIQIVGDFTNNTTTSTSCIVWGPGTINGKGSAKLSYATGAGAAVATFVNTGGITLNGQTTAYSLGPGAVAVWNGGVTINPTNLDAAFGTSGFGGRAIQPGGASISNVGV